ncbi:putative quinol monooxygenase [Vibrio rumoiensis]|uniref:Antibiotic biosynthesis monooxygenase n=1 Tax=Vibrio rumoiensis 1S-45 TaxID=1188252 RepID=A0A1E5E4W1_9VIBR|nr:antibiotic biosynthesis monooxygenase [Vibrio rumoiensis]OEF28174.1 antibiotic biosynthesis monooxygenase [Vibrio rumoiensis 1S-45]
MFCIIVKNEVKVGCREQYLSIMKANAKASVLHEPECFAFDVLEDQKNDHHFYLYEIYANESGLALHKETHHYLESRKGLADIVENVTVIRCDVIERN